MEGRRLRALIAVDSAVLDQLLADDLTYTHASGNLEIKAEFMACVETGKLKYLSLEPEESRVRVSGDTAIVTGRAAMKVKPAGSGESGFRSRYIDVYLKRNGKCKCVTCHSTRLSDS